LAAPKTAVDNSGNVFLASTYDQTFTFGSKEVSNDDQLASAFLAKYDKDGNEQWVATIYGSATISGIDTDDEGNVYICGTLTDLVTYTGADGTEATAGTEGETAIVYGFVAKLDASGTFETFRTIVPAADSDISSSGMYYPEDGDISFSPRKLMVSGDKVYVSAVSKGDVTFDNVNWEGSYLNVFDYVYMDLSSMGVISLSTEDLSGATSVAYVQASENLSSTQQNPESLSFTVDNDVVYLCLVGKGTEKLTTPNGDTTLEMNVASDESGNMEHPFILASVGTSDNVKILHVAQHSMSYGTDQVNSLFVQGDALYVTGTYYNQLGFDTEKSSTGSADMFAASVSTSDFSTNWAVTSGYDEGDVSKMQEILSATSFSDGKIFLAGFVQSKDEGEPLLASLAYNATSTGMTSASSDWIKASDTNTNASLTSVAGSKGTNLSLAVYHYIASGITMPNISESNKQSKIYTLSGVQINNASNIGKGIIIKDGKKYVVK
jgi:hypothetical protein